jgi:hypothetical protein
VLRPESPPDLGSATASAVLLPLFPTYRIACSASRRENRAEHAPSVRELRGAKPAGLAANTHFLGNAWGDSMDGGPEPVRHGDYLLLEWARNIGRADLVGRAVLAEYRDERRDPVLKVLERAPGGGYLLTPRNPGRAAIEGTTDIQIVATLTRRVPQAELNPLALHQLAKREAVAALYGEEFNPGNWNSGHVSLPGKVVLFVTLHKSKDMSAGSHYEDHLEAPVEHHP